MTTSIGNRSLQLLLLGSAVEIMLMATSVFSAGSEVDSCSWNAGLSWPAATVDFSNCIGIDWNGLNLLSSCCWAILCLDCCRSSLVASS
jgi:hypothetical protein